jgi:hypothetical protein
MASVAGATAALGAAQEALSTTDAFLLAANADAEGAEEDSPTFTRIMDEQVAPLLAAMKKQQKAVARAEKALRFARKKSKEMEGEEGVAVNGAEAKAVAVADAAIAVKAAATAATAATTAGRLPLDGRLEALMVRALRRATEARVVSDAARILRLLRQLRGRTPQLATTGMDTGGIDVIAAHTAGGSTGSSQGGSNATVATVASTAGVDAGADADAVVDSSGGLPGLPSQRPQQQLQQQQQHHIDATREAMRQAEALVKEHTAVWWRRLGALLYACGLDSLWLLGAAVLGYLETSWKSVFYAFFARLQGAAMDGNTRKAAMAAVATLVATVVTRILEAIHKECVARGGIRMRQRVQLRLFGQLLQV